MDLLVYGKRIRINECDAFTREYLTSQGIEVNPNETAPADIFTQSRHQPAQTYTTPSYGIAKKTEKVVSKTLVFMYSIRILVFNLQTVSYNCSKELE